MTHRPMSTISPLIPAKAGIQHRVHDRIWVPASAGTSGSAQSYQAEIEQ